MYFFALSAERARKKLRPGGNDHAQHAGLGLPYRPPRKRTRLLQEMADSRLGQEIQKMSLDRFVVLKRKEILKKKTKPKYTDGDMKELPTAKATMTGATKSSSSMGLHCQSVTEISMSPY